MRLIDELMHPPTNLGGCHQVMKRAAHENARLRSMLFQFLDGGAGLEFRTKVAEVLGVKLSKATRITDDAQFSPFNDEN